MNEPSVHAVQSPIVHIVLCAALLATAAIATGCGEDGGNNSENCLSGYVYDDTLGRCVRIDTDTTMDMPVDSRPDLPDGADSTDAVDGTDGTEDGTDIVPDVPPADMIDPMCDKDNDGALAMECGGNDCDDNVFLRNPNSIERCDEIDNNCNEQVNEGIMCFFYAHSGDALYRVDPFALTATEVTGILDQPTLTDIDTHPNGTLYGITASGGMLYRFNNSGAVWELVGSYPNVTDATGLAIDTDGTGYVTAGELVYSLNLTTAVATPIGSLGTNPDTSSPWYSSGDCVLNKVDTMYMTSKETGEDDTLVLVDRATGAATGVGSVGFDSIYGLTFAWGKLYGLNSDGNLIDIDPATGAGTLVHTFTGIRWFGAASFPAR